MATKNWKSEIWEKDRPLESILAYLALFIAGPIILTGLLWVILRDWLRRLWKGRQPAARTEQETTPEREDTVLVDLVRRRAAVDSRLAGAKVDEWPMCSFWPTPEAMILDVIGKYHQLRRAGATDDLIWTKLEAYRADFGTALLSQPCSLSAFLVHRLALEDPLYIKLGTEFLQTQIERCEKFALQYIGDEGQSHGWPPAEWLTEKISLDQLPAPKSIPLVTETRAQAIMQLRAYKSRQEIKTLEVLMLPGDEVWTFTSPPQSWQRLMGRSGIALVREVIRSPM
jgi:hypothetical protein